MAAQGLETFFEDDGWYQVTVQVPPPANTTYTLAYDGAGKLDRITDPAGRVLEANVSGGVLATLGDPSGSVMYGYDGDQRLTTRTNRRGHQTTYRYVNGLRITGVEIPLSSATDLGVTSLSYWDERGLVIGQPGGGPYTAYDPALVYIHLDGPRNDLPDATRFWVDRWGAPTRIEQNAIGSGHNTFLQRSDPNVPALVTQVQAPNGFITRATYDERGNVRTTTEVDPYAPNDTLDAVTSYEWDPTWDFMTKIKRAERDSVMFGYDAGNGNRRWQQDGRGTDSVKFNYNNPLSLLSSIVRPGGARDSIRYSAELGNPYWFRTPGGFVTTLEQDLMGRDTVVLTPIDAAQQYQHRQQFVYDAMNRVRQYHSVAPEVSGVAAESLLVWSYFDNEGNLDSLKRWSVPNTASVGQLKTQWRYDFAGRPVKEIAPDGERDSTVYDAAGNVIQVITRRSHTLTMAYDTLNRLTQRIVPDVRYGPRSQGIATLSGLQNYNPTPYPWYTNAAGGELTSLNDGNDSLTIRADTARFTYDPTGNLLTADNADAKVRRSYYPNGRVKTDSLLIRTYGGNDFSQHKYGLRYAYDRNGRPVTVEHPSALRKSSPGVGTQYAYDPRTGFLSQVTDLFGNTYQYFYNSRDEVTSVRLPGGVVDSALYDLDGRLRTSLVFKSAGPSYRQATLEYSGPNRLGAWRNAVGMKDTVTAEYTGLGHLSQMTWQLPAFTLLGNPARLYSTEQFTLDALGNTYQSLDLTNISSSTGDRNVQSVRTSSYSPIRTGRLSLVDGPRRDDNYLYDAAGNTVFSYSSNHSATSPTSQEDRASYYGADGLLRVSEYRRVDRSSDNGVETWPWWDAFEEYRYDALGRRVLVRTRRKCGSHFTNEPCRFSTIRRTVWDGNRELYEIQQPGGDAETAATLENDTLPVQLGACYPNTCSNSAYDRSLQFGYVGYTYTGGVDRPVGLTRFNYVDWPSGGSPIVWQPFTVVPHWNWRDQAEYGTFGDGGENLCTSPGSSRCVQIYWRPKAFAFTQQRGDLETGWFGTLRELKEDGTGTLYRRNRYVDPATGRFTQEDPIGLAGGLNLYGFANGDPINFSDPFGLCPDPNDILCALFEGSFTLLGGTLGFIGGGGLGLLEIAGTGGIATPAAVATAGAGMALGAAAGTAFGQALSNVLFRDRDPAASRGRTGGTSKTVGQTRIKRQQVRVDVEFATGGSTGNVHVQIKGPGGPQKIFINSADDLSALPGSIRESADIQRWVRKAFDLLQRYQP